MPSTELSSVTPGGKRSAAWTPAEARSKANTSMPANRWHLNEKQELDLIISDILMPNLSGLSLLSLLKQFYFNKIPVILISALDQSPVILSSLGLGADDFIAKPINFQELLLRVKKFAK